MNRESSGSKGAIANAKKIELLRKNIVEERWLSTWILTVHMEIEIVLTELLKHNLPKPEKFLNRSHKPSFADKLVLCDSLNLINEKLSHAIWSLNRLRNELAHQFEDVPSVDNLSKFIEDMSGIHPLKVTIKDTKSTKKLRTFQQIKTHFLKAPREEFEQFVFVSLLLLRSNAFCLIKDSECAD